MSDFKKKVYNTMMATSSVATPGLDLFYHVHSQIIPAYVLTGHSLVQDIENLETSQLTTIIEYPKLSRFSVITARSYKVFVQHILEGTAARLIVDKAGTNLYLKFSEGVLTDADNVLLAIGYDSSNLPKNIDDFLIGTEDIEPSEDLIMTSKLYVSSSLLIEPQYKILYKTLRDLLLYQEEDFTIVKNLTHKMYTPVPLEPMYKRPTERKRFLESLPSLLVALEEEEEEEKIKKVDEVAEIKTVEKVEISIEREAEEWTPPGFEW